jgi:hypothetical protein
MRYKVSHPSYGKQRIFPNWIDLVDHTVDLATEIITAQMPDMITKLSDEMIETAEEYGS